MTNNQPTRRLNTRTRARRRLRRLFDWKLVAACTGFLFVAVLAGALVQQQRVIDQRGHALSRTLDDLAVVQTTADRNADTLAAFQRAWAKRSRQAALQRDRLQAQVEALTRALLADRGIDLAALIRQAQHAAQDRAAAGAAGGPTSSGDGGHVGHPPGQHPRPPSPRPTPGQLPEQVCVPDVLHACIPLLPLA